MPSLLSRRISLSVPLVWVGVGVGVGVGVVQVADIGHLYAPQQVHIKWSERLEEEMWLQGDVEKQRDMKVCVCMCVFMCVYVREREREREGVCKGECVCLLELCHDGVCAEVCVYILSDVRTTFCTSVSTIL